MSARYLRCAIREQIDRAESLRAAIPDRQRHAAPERLADACSAISSALKMAPVRLRAMAGRHGVDALKLGGGGR